MIGVWSHIARIPFLKTLATHACPPPHAFLRALVTKDAATPHGAMRKSNIRACNSVRHKPTRQDLATSPDALRTSPCISTTSPPPEDSWSSRQSFATGRSFYIRPACANVGYIPFGRSRPAAQSVPSVRHTVNSGSTAVHSGPCRRLYRPHHYTIPAQHSGSSIPLW